MNSEFGSQELVLVFIEYARSSINQYEKHATQTQVKNYKLKSDTDSRLFDMQYMSAGLLQL